MKPFARVAAAGIAFQAGSAAIDSATIMAALVFQLTGSPVLVGAVTAILRFGWLFPQLLVGFLVQRDGSSMRYYVLGAFGRASCMAVLALVLHAGAHWTAGMLAGAVMVLWTVYAFVSGIVAVPYNDIVARSVPSERRSRLLATRFFGGGVLALGIAAMADRLVGTWPFPLSYAAIIAMASGLMFLSSVIFTSMGEPAAERRQPTRPGFFRYLKDGRETFRTDNRFRRFVFAQWCGGAVLMAMPFYVVQASASGFSLDRVAWLLGAQTAGALLSNALWGWWGDRRGKASLLRTIALGRTVPPAAIILLSFFGLPEGSSHALIVFSVLFFLLGALANGLTIAVIGFLMEISPAHLRPAYSGYFNALTAPAFLLPLLAGFLAGQFGLNAVFIISLVAALLQSLILMRIDRRPQAVPANDGTVI